MLTWFSSKVYSSLCCCSQSDQDLALLCLSWEPALAVWIKNSIANPAHLLDLSRTLTCTLEADPGCFSIAEAWPKQPSPNLPDYLQIWTSKVSPQIPFLCHCPFPLSLPRCHKGSSILDKLSLPWAINLQAEQACTSLCLGEGPGEFTPFPSMPW